jgi:hypothetical protein
MSVSVSGTSIVEVAAGAVFARRLVELPTGIHTPFQVLLTSRLTRGRANPDEPGPLFVPFSHIPGFSQAFYIWVAALDQQPVPQATQVYVDWAVID